MSQPLWLDFCLDFRSFNLEILGNNVFQGSFGTDFTIDFSWEFRVQKLFSFYAHQIPYQLEAESLGPHTQTLIHNTQFYYGYEYKNAELYFMCLLATCTSFFEKSTVHTIWPFLNWIVYFVVVESLALLKYFEHESFIDCVIWKYSLPFYWFPPYLTWCNPICVLLLCCLCNLGFTWDFA